MVWQKLKQAAFPSTVDTIPFKSMSVLPFLYPFCLALSPHIYLSILAEQDRNDVLRQRIIFKENLKKIGGYII